MIWFGEIILSIIIFLSAVFKWFSLPGSIFIIAISILGVLWKLHRSYTYWERLGIKGPKANILFGNSLQMRGGVANAQQRWYNDYGEIVGCYLFGKTELQVADTKILKEVMLQKFSYFTDRVNFIPINGGDRSNLLSNTLLFMTGEKWKNVRSQITPTFTTGKIRMMFPIFNSSAMICGDILQQKQDCGEPIDLKDVCGRLTLDTIAKCGFGADLNVQNTENSSFYEYAKIFFKIDRKSPGLLFLFFFPKIAPFIQRLTGRTFLRPEANSYFTNLLTEIFTKRKEDRMRDDGIRKNDFFDLLLDSLQGENFNGDDNDLLFEEIKNSRKKKLTELDIIAQGFVFLLAGYDTASTTMSILLYHLAVFQDIQTKLKEEIDQNIDDENNISFDQIMKCSYLDQILKETLRMYPTFVRVNRICTIPTTVGDGIPIRKNDVISIPIRVIHFNEKLYSEPYKFNPDRFSSSHHSDDPLAFIPFGYGPRNCIGMRIAQFHIKIAVAHLIKRFHLGLCENSPSLPLDFISFGPIKVTNTLNISITPRI